MDNKLDVMSLMTDQMKAVIAKQQELATPFDTNATLDDMRRNYVVERRFWNEGGPVMAKTVDTTFAGPAGDFTARFYYPADAESLPAIVYIHGGGWVVGSIDTHDRICRLLAEKCGAAVVSVDYHLSPEAKFPDPVKECAMVAKHVHEHGAELGIDGDDISFAGDSAGALMCLSTYLWLRDEEGDASYVKSLLLYYGFYGLADSASRRLLGNELDGLTKADLDYYMDCYLASPEDLQSPYVDMLSNDLSTLPPCYIVSAGLDPLRDDSRCLAAICQARGIDHVYDEVDGVLHAFLHHTRMLDEANMVVEHGSEFFTTRRAR